MEYEINDIIPANNDFTFHQNQLPGNVLRSLIFPFCLVLIVFFPIFQGRIPLNIDWLTAHHYPWKAFSTLPVHNTDIDDPVIEFYPLAHKAAETLRNGRIPLWNSDVGCGTPLLADFISQPLDPAFLLSIMLTPAPAITWTILLLLQQLLLAWSVVLFLVQRRCTTFGASVGATAVVFSSPIITWMQLRRLTASIICLFLTLYAIERFRHKPVYLIIVSAAALAFGVVAGHPQYTLYAWLIATGYLLLRACPERSLIKRFFSVSLVLISATALSAPAILPQLELLQQTVRGEPGRYFSMFRFGAGPWISLFVPDFLGHPASRDYFGKFIYFRSYTTLPILYFGALPLTAAMLGLRHWRKLSWVFPAMAFSLLSLLTVAALRPVRLWLFDHCPGLFNIDPGRAGMLTALLLAAWSGEAFSALQANRITGRCRAIICLVPFAIMALILATASIVFLVAEDHFARIVRDNSLLLYIMKLQTDHGNLLNVPSIRHALIMFLAAGIGLALVNQAKTRWLRHLATAAIGVILAFDLVPWSMRFNPFIDPAKITLPPEYDATLNAARDPMFRATGLDRTASFKPQSEIFPPNTLLLFRIPDFRVYTSTPPAGHTRLINSVQSRTYWDRSVKSPVKPLLDLASVKWIFTHPDFYEDQLETQRIGRNSGLTVFQNRTALPRLRLTGVFSCDEENPDRKTDDDWVKTIWSRLRSNPEGFRYQTLVFGEGAELSRKLAIPEHVEGHVESVEWSDNEIRSVIHAETAALAVLSDTWYPGWKALVNRRPVPVIRANGLFRGIPVEAGISHISLRYEPVSYRLGVFLMLLTAGSMIAVVMCSDRREVKNE